MTDMSLLSDADLEALAKNDYSAMSDEGLAVLAGEDTQPVQTTQVASDLPTGGLPGEPLPEQSSAVQSGTPSLRNYAMEAVTGANRAGASAFDIATSPLQLMANVAGFDVPTLRSTIPERGEFAGPGIVTDVLGAGGELGISSLTAGGFSRAVSQSLDDLVRMGADETTLMNVFREMGRTTPTQDVILGSISGAGGEIAEVAGIDFLGEDAAQASEFTGQVISPVAWMATTKTIQNAARSVLESSINSGIRNNAPTVERLRGAGQVLYHRLDDAGLMADEGRSNRLISIIDSFIQDETIDSALPQLNNRLRVLRNQAETGEVSFAYIDRIRSHLQRISSGEDVQATLAGDFVDSLDVFISGLKPTNTSALRGQDIQDVIRDARALWRRASVNDTMSNVFRRASIKSEGGGQPFETVLKREITSLLNNKKKMTFFTSEEAELIRQVNKGEGGMESFLNLVSRAAPNSEDWVKAIIFGSVGGLFNPVTRNASAAGLAYVTVTEGARKAASNIYGKNANYMRQVLRAGPNAMEITRSYMRNTPVSRRRPGELTSLYLANDADLSSLRDTGIAETRLVSDAVALAIAGQEITRQERLREAEKPLEDQTTQPR
jgi:hypothetical protein